MPLVRHLLQPVGADALNGVPQLKVLHDSAKSARVSHCLLIVIKSMRQLNLPITSNFAAELLGDALDIGRGQSGELRMAHNHAPCHDGRNLAVEIQTLA